MGALSHAPCDYRSTYRLHARRPTALVERSVERGGVCKSGGCRYSRCDRLGAGRRARLELPGDTGAQLLRAGRIRYTWAAASPDRIERAMPRNRGRADADASRARRPRGVETGGSVSLDADLAAHW